MKTHLQQFLEAEAALMKRLRNKRSGWHCLAEFVLTHGRAWKPGPLPPDIKPMKLGECFKNAAEVALGFHRNEYLYCEGYAISVIPVMHAWLVDLDGNVIDPTWTDRPKSKRNVIIPPIGSDYFGIAFNAQYLHDALLRQEYYGLIDAWRDDWPILHAQVEDWRHTINDVQLQP